MGFKELNTFLLKATNMSLKEIIDEYFDIELVKKYITNQLSDRKNKNLIKK